MTLVKPPEMAPGKSRLGLGAASARITIKDTGYGSRRFGRIEISLVPVERPLALGASRPCCPTPTLQA
jgi:hypothetical protein